MTDSSVIAPVCTPGHDVGAICSDAEVTSAANSIITSSVQSQDAINSAVNSITMVTMPMQMEAGGIQHNAMATDGEKVVYGMSSEDGGLQAGDVNLHVGCVEDVSIIVADNSEAIGMETAPVAMTTSDGMTVIQQSLDEEGQVDQSGMMSQFPNSSMILGPNAGGLSTVSLADPAAISNLLASGGNAQITTATGETIQVITIASPQDMAQMGKYWQVVPATMPDDATVVTIGDQEQAQVTEEQFVSQGMTVESDGQMLNLVPVQQAAQLGLGLVDPMSMANMASPIPPQNLPPGTPPWAVRLRDCERIGSFYRGWVETEGSLDVLLTFHKQQTQSFWGTRQSPCLAKPSSRLMWKSQYVPFDGIPFINAGSRAIVMECQFGPRRKGAQPRRHGNTLIKEEFKQTCPARIYIKKVRKFPDYRVDIHMDKKVLKVSMDRAFQLLKEKPLESIGEDRYYVQLPLEEAHDFHSEAPAPPPTMPLVEPPPSLDENKIHPAVLQRIRELVASGETRLYPIRKNLRRFVERELFERLEEVPEKHNLSFFPTVNALQNHIHQAIKDIETGLLQVTAQTVNVEVITEGGGGDSEDLPNVLWHNTAPGERPHAETVTVTLTQQPGEDGVVSRVSRVETHLSDGSTQVSNTLTPETAKLLSKLHPNMFPAGALVSLHSEDVMPPPPITMVSTPDLQVHPVTMVGNMSYDIDQSALTHDTGHSVIGSEAIATSVHADTDWAVVQAGDEVQYLGQPGMDDTDPSGMMTITVMNRAVEVEDSVKLEPVDSDKLVADTMSREEDAVLHHDIVLDDQSHMDTDS